MKLLLIVCLALVVGVAVGWMVNGVSPADAAGGPGGGAAPLGNGDVNGDGKINVSDAVYLLAHLFTGGPPVKPIECPPVQPAGVLPDTGQSMCYDFAPNQGWVPVSCDDHAECLGRRAQGQDAAYNTGCPSERRFVDNGDGTVSDRCTGLMWQKGTADTNGDGTVNDKDPLLWCDAIRYCENLSFAGRDDWRLPNIRELQSIVDYGRFAPSIDPDLGALSTWYWSSTTYANTPTFAWIVYFGWGSVYDAEKSQAYSLKAVRSGP